MFNSDLTASEILGFTSETPRQAWLALRGDPNVPGSRFGPSSLRIFTPRLAVATWAGKKLLGGKLPVVNLVNRTPTPIEQGWSVQVTRVRDFRGRALTYDSHNGTDFAVPPGTRVVAAAPGHVVAIRNEYNRGGLKLYIDHGDGLLTASNHLARVLVSVGDRVHRGQHVALSGYSGIDALASFPWVAPHIHFNVMHGGVLVDPFAAEGEVPLWRGGNAPEPAALDVTEPANATRFDAGRVADALAVLKDEGRRALLAAIDDVTLRAWGVAIEASVYPTRFASTAPIRALFDDVPRAPRLDLPVSPADYDGLAFADDEGLR